MSVSSVIRVVATAVLLSTLSFAAGIAGDLSMADPPNYGERVVLRIPPEIPADAERARPLPPLLSTASAEASPIRFTPFLVSYASFALLEKPSSEMALLPIPKIQTVLRAAKPALRRKAG